MRVPIIRALLLPMVRLVVGRTHVVSGAKIYRTVLQVRVVQHLPPWPHLRRHVLVLGLPALVQQVLLGDSWQIWRIR